MSTCDDGTKSQGGGPKTPRGKSIARWNALKHGATAKQLFISNGQHLPEFERYRHLAEELQEQLAPGAYLEDAMLVQKFVWDAWMAERGEQLLQRLLPRGDDAIKCELAPNSLRYIVHVQRNFIKSLEIIRDLRGRVEETEAAEAKADTEAADEQSSTQESKTDNGQSSKSADVQCGSPDSAPDDKEG